MTIEDQNNSVSALADTLIEIGRKVSLMRDNETSNMWETNRLNDRIEALEKDLKDKNERLIGQTKTITSYKQASLLIAASIDNIVSKYRGKHLSELKGIVSTLKSIK